MADTIVQAYGTGTGGSQANVANVNVPYDGTLEGIQISHMATLNADTEESVLQVSEIAAIQVNVNDARGILANSQLRMGLLTSGAAIAQSNFYIPVDRRVSAGGMIYLHISATAATNTTALVVLYFSRRGAR